jgi:L-arabonate dehydrase
VSEEELAARCSKWRKPEPAMKGGYQQLYLDRVMQADKGADFDFLVGCRGAAVPRESH